MIIITASAAFASIYFSFDEPFYVKTLQDYFWPTPNDAAAVRAYSSDPKLVTSKQENTELEDRRRLFLPSIRSPACRCR